MPVDAANTVAVAGSDACERRKMPKIIVTAQVNSRSEFAQPGMNLQGAHFVPICGKGSSALP